MLDRLDPDTAEVVAQAALDVVLAGPAYPDLGPVTAAMVARVTAARGATVEFVALCDAAEEANGGRRISRNGIHQRLQIARRREPYRSLIVPVRGAGYRAGA